MDFNELLSFRKMITPTIIKILFWLGIVGVVFMALGAMTRGGLAAVLVGFLILILGPIFVRVQCELILVAFRILEVLTEIRDGKKPEGPGAPQP